MHTLNVYYAFNFQLQILIKQIVKEAFSASIIVKEIIYKRFIIKVLISIFFPLMLIKENNDQLSQDPYRQIF